MQSPIHLNKLLEEISNLTSEDQAFLSEILTKRLIQSRRNEIASRAKEA